MRLAVLDQGREPVALCPASGCDSGRGRGGGASGGPSGAPCLGRGISEDRMSLKRVLGPRFWLVGAQWSQRCFSSAAQSSKPSQRHGRTRVELRFTKRSVRHASVFFPQGRVTGEGKTADLFCSDSRAVGAAPWGSEAQPTVAAPGASVHLHVGSRRRAATPPTSRM